MMMHASGIEVGVADAVTMEAGDMSLPPHTDLSSPLATTNTTSSPHASLSSNSNEFNSVDSTAFSYDKVFPALGKPSTNKPIMPPTAINKMRIGSSTITQVFVIPRDERKVDSSSVFGKDECTNISNATNTKIELSSNKNQALTFLVTGKQADVLEAKKRIIAHFQTPTTSKITVPKEHHGSLLGKKGQRLKDLEKETACKISMPPKEADQNETITVTGPKDGVEKAIHEIKITLGEISKQCSEKVNVPKMYHPFICGANNETVNRIMEETGVKIHIPPNSVQNDIISIVGEKESVLAAKARIDDIHRKIHAKCSSVSVEVPKAQHKYIIGPKRSTIAEILQMTNVSVEIPPLDSATDTITLRGPQDKLGQALTMVYAKASSAMMVTLSAPEWLHKRLRGKKNANIRRYMDGTNLHIEFKDDTIRIEGPPEEVEATKVELSREIDDCLKTLVCEELDVDQKFYKHIIGKNGANVNRMKEETGVEMDLIKEGTGSGVVRLEGTREAVDKARKEIREMIEKLENEKERELSVDHRLFPQIIGTHGQRMREIRDLFKQVVISLPGGSGGSGTGPNNNDPPPWSDENVVRLRGPEDEVDKCAKYLQKIVDDLRIENFRLEVPIYKQFHKFIVGKGGQTIRKIRDETQTKIDLPNENDLSEYIVITGRQERVLQARDRIKKIQDEMAASVTEEISIPQKYYNSLIGLGGKLIQGISEDCGNVQIKFPPQDSNSDKVLIRGPKEDVKKAIQQLEDLKNEREASNFTTTVEAKPQFHRFLIGKNGATIRRIREATGTRIIFPSEKDENKETITIVGKKNEVDKAKIELERLLEDCRNVIEDEIIVPMQHHKHFVARRGAIIHQISDECGGVTISFPRVNTDSDKVILKGGREGIEMAKKRIEETVRELEAMVTIDCVIPQKHHRTVMGVRGSKVQEITQRFNVQIKFPDRDQQSSNSNNSQEDVSSNPSPDLTVNGEVTSDSSSCNISARPGDIIRITGSPENCEAAKEALFNLVPITIEVPVAYELHRSIIGKSGGSVRQLMDDFDVHIVLSPPDQKLDFVRVTGTADNVANARDAINERVAQLERDKEDRKLKSYQVTLEVDPEYHSSIIGKKGQVIMKIRDQYKVNVNLPKRGEPDENIITITGYENDANDARDHILSIVNELKERVRREIQVDSRVHSRLIGQRGRGIKKLAEEYGIELKFARPTDENPNQIIVIGPDSDTVEEAIDHILDRADDYMREIEEKEYRQKHLRPGFTANGRESSDNSSGGNSGGFIVKGAPWENTNGQQRVTPDTNSIRDFPSFGASAVGNDVAGGTDATPLPTIATWGPRR